MKIAIPIAPANGKSEISMQTLLTILLVCLVATSTGFAVERDINEKSSFSANNLLVDISTLDISLRAADVNNIEVNTELHISNVTESQADDWVARHTPSFEEGHDSLKVVVKPGRNGFIWFGHLTAKARLNIVAPLSVMPDLTTESGRISARGDFSNAKPMLMRTSSGDIEFSGAAHSLNIHTTTGDTHIEVMRPIEKLFARNASGDITLIGGARNIEIDTSSGNIWLSNLSGSTKITSSNGKVNLRWDRLDQNHVIYVRTSSAKINLSVPSSVRPRGILKTTTGTIRSDFPGTVSEAGDAVELGGDGPRFDVETASGEIILTQAEF